MLYTLLTLAGVVLAVAFVFSIIVIRKQRHKELDKGMNATSVKHPVVGNPVTFFYVLFPVIIIVGGALWYYYS